MGAPDSGSPQTPRRASGRLRTRRRRAQGSAQGRRALLRSGARGRYRGPVQSRVDVCERTRRGARRRRRCVAVHAWRRRADTPTRRGRSRSSATNAGALPDCMGSPEPPWVDAGARHGRRPRSLRRPAGLESRRSPTSWRRSRRATRSIRGSRLSVIPVESNFEPRALSARNARGLMQLDPGNRGPVQRRERVRRARQPAWRPGVSALASRILSRARFRLPSPRTTPAKRRSTGTAAFRRIRKRRTTCGACCGCFAAIGILTIPAIVDPSPILAPAPSSGQGRRPQCPCSRAKSGMRARIRRRVPGPGVLLARAMPSRTTPSRRSNASRGRSLPSGPSSARARRLSVQGNGIRRRRRNAHRHEFARAARSARSRRASRCSAILLPASGKDQVAGQGSEDGSRSNPDSDLALLKIDGPPLPALKLARFRHGPGRPVRTVHRVSDRARARSAHPATHRGMIAAISPIAIPQGRSAELDAQVIRRLTSGAYPVFQLDATAYPGNSGSPVYDPESGRGPRHHQHGVRQGHEGNCTDATQRDHLCRARRSTCRTFWTRRGNTN